jgi:hypothetical protein
LKKAKESFDVCVLEGRNKIKKRFAICGGSFSNKIVIISEARAEFCLDDIGGSWSPEGGDGF